MFPVGILLLLLKSNTPPPPQCTVYCDLPHRSGHCVEPFRIPAANQHGYGSPVQQPRVVGICPCGMPERCYGYSPCKFFLPSSNEPSSFTA